MLCGPRKIYVTPTDQHPAIELWPIDKSQEFKIILQPKPENEIENGKSVVLLTED